MADPTLELRDANAESAIVTKFAWLLRCDICGVNGTTGVAIVEVYQFD